ncbi:hypothetical protein pah_c029o010 [Parachlamydia acanthamoebae str. Hall's coccus]|nr:hypothetical protein pah_c029o010 [Parachlamydia acanthamoebae str. Hall's coccus]
MHLKFCKTIKPFSCILKNGPNFELQPLKCAAILGLLCNM